MRNGLARVVALVIAFSLLAAAHAQLFTIANVGKDEIALTVERGFNPSYYWSGFTDHDICPWAEYRNAINVLNPQYVADAFHDIPVGGTFVVPMSCATSEALRALRFAEEILLGAALAEVLPSQPGVVELGPETLAALGQMISEAVNNSAANQIEIDEPLVIAPLPPRIAPPAEVVPTIVPPIEMLPEVAPVTPIQSALPSSSSDWQRVAAWPYWIYVTIALLILFALAWFFLPVFRRKRAHQDFARLNEDVIEQGRRFVSLKGRHDKLEQDYQDVLALHSEVEREKNSQVALVANLRKDIELLKQENADLTSQIKAANDRFKEVQKQPKNIKEEVVEVVEVFETKSVETVPAESPVVATSPSGRKPRGGKRQARSISAAAKKAEEAKKKNEEQKETVS